MKCRFYTKVTLTPLYTTWKRNTSTFQVQKIENCFISGPLLPSECRLHANQELDAPFVFWNCSYFAACDTLRNDTPN
jgi:hypothetical protein